MRAFVAGAVLLAGCGSATPGYDPAKGAEFRFNGRELVSRLDPQCPRTTSKALLARYEPVRARLTALKRKVSGSSLGTDLSIVEADERYSQSVTLVECVEPDGSDAERYLSNDIETMSNHLGRMEAIAQQQGHV